jgi:hypothetical protein
MRKYNKNQNRKRGLSNLESKIQVSKNKAFETRLRKQLLQVFRLAIFQSRFKRTPRRFLRAANIEFKDNTICAYIDAEGVTAQDQGVRRHYMTYLRGAGPVMIKQGVFRKAPAKNSLIADQWLHKGYKGKKFMQRARARMLEVLKKELAQHTKKMLFGRLRGQK